MEEEHNRSLPFLDVLVTRQKSGILSHSVYRKPTHTDRYLNKRSFHHPSTKKVVCNTLIRRAQSISDRNSIQKEMQHVKEALKLNGYHMRDLKIQKRSNSQDDTEPRKSDKPPANSQPGVYRIPCECGKVYIGETGRDLRTRLKEHQGHARRGEQQKSSIVMHSHTHGIYRHSPKSANG
ncbi:uncharacterized protein LOC117101183 [Anneissia japonica]|uniref:uncharacterized protein LOC117101183 n=1 Tax=Anneissia japonica TaxID=1529436 RepID=UPI001425610F|nr:uncharacterized protein LOC117101183 [Anneissia japonica]